MEPPPGDTVPVPAGEFEPPPIDGRERRYHLPWEWWDALAIYFIWIVLAGGAAALLAQAFADPLSDAATATGVLAAVILLTLVVLGWVAMRGDRAGVGDAVRRAFGPKRPELRDVWLGIGYGIGGFVVIQLGLGIALTTLIESLGRELPPIQEGVQEAARAGGTVPVLIGVGVVLFGPLGEELLYRGVLYQALARDLPGWPAVGLSGLAFGVTHVEPFVIALTFPLGMLLAWAQRRHGTLLVPLTAHVVFNLIGFTLIAFGDPTATG